MNNDAHEKLLQDMVSQDWAARLRDLEQLQPRVHALEHAVTDIRSEVREARAEQQEEHRETRQALNSFRKRMDIDYRGTVAAMTEIASTTTVAITGLVGRVDVLTRKVAFATGALYVLMGISGLVMAYRVELLTMIKAILGGSV